MTNQLTQEELKQLAKDAGAYMDYDIHRVYSLFFPDGALAKFAQLIQQRQGEVEPVAWFAFADSNGPVPLELWGFDEKECKYAVLMNARATGWKGTIEGYLLHAGWSVRPVYAAPPTTSQLVAQALEKEAEVVWEFRDHASGDLLCDLSKLRESIRALIDQPINKLPDVNDIDVANMEDSFDHYVDANKMVDINDKQPCQSSVNDKPVEQGGDELVEALERIVNLSPSQFFTMSDMAEECQNIARQALANRRGRE